MRPGSQPIYLRTDFLHSFRIGNVVTDICPNPISVLLLTDLATVCSLSSPWKQSISELLQIPSTRNCNLRHIFLMAKDADLPPHRSAHGLRKAICVRLAEVGCDPYEIMAITGHQNLAEVMTYIAGVNTKKQAEEGMAKLSMMAG